MIRAGHIIVLLVLWASSHLCAAEPIEITWDDLLPEQEATFDDPFAKLSEDQLLELGLVARIRFLLESEKIAADGPDAKEEREIVARLAAQNIDVDYLLSQRERVARERRQQAERVDTEIDGKEIKIPGYMLPLKREAAAVTEFLLVPWVGACIHTPPPPPNQMVHVSVPDGTPDKGRFAAIWIEGTLSLKPASYQLFLIDGKRDINVAYTMELDSVSGYSSKESDTLAKVEIPEDLAGEHSWLQGMQNKISLMFTKTMTDIKDQRTSGALLVLLFGVANNLLWPAIIMVVSISLGMALALAAVGVAAILGRRFVDKRVGHDAARQHRVACGLRIASAAAVIFIGSAFALTWFGQIAV